MMNEVKSNQQIRHMANKLLFGVRDWHWNFEGSMFQPISEHHPGILANVIDDIGSAGYGTDNSFRLFSIFALET